MTDTPAGSPLPGTSGTGRRDVISVAELLARNGAAQDEPGRDEAGPLTGPVLSVGDLLRREGRAAEVPAPAADVAADAVPGDWPDIDLPQPREAAGGQQWPVRPGGGRRRAGAVAGALVAAGSVLGAAIYNGASSQDSDAQAAADGLFPGIGLPSGDASPATLPGQYLPANVVLSTPLPPTAPGAADWMSVAFPQQRTAPPRSAAGTLREVSTTTGSGAAAAVPAQRVTSTAATRADAPTTAAPGPATASPTTPVRAGGPTGSTATGSPLGEVPLVRAINNQDRAPAGNLLEPLSAPAPSSEREITGPLQGATENVRPVGRVLGGGVAPIARAAAPVGELAGSALSPVTDAVRPVTRALQPVTRPLTNTLEPVTTPVLGALSPVTGPILEGTAPLTDPVLGAVEPVTSLLNTSAAEDSTDSSSGSGASSRSQASAASEGTSDSDSSDGSGSGGGLSALTRPVGNTLGTVTEPVGDLLGGR